VGIKDKVKAIPPGQAKKLPLIEAACPARRASSRTSIRFRARLAEGLVNAALEARVLTSMPSAAGPAASALWRNDTHRDRVAC
jgi:hypothetical protein